MASETNNIGFEIQRSADNVSYITLAFIPGAGVSQKVHNYSYTDNVRAPGRFYYRLKQINSDGSCSYSKAVQIVLSAPAFFELEQNYPNPCNSSTTIQFVLPASGYVSLVLFDVTGKKVQMLVDDLMQSGSHAARFDAVDHPSGVYYYVMHVSGFQEMKKLIVLR